MMFLKILHNLPESGVDTKLEPFVEFLIAQWALTLLFAFPVPGDTGLAEVVSTWNRNRLGENIQTDGTLELILRQERAGCGHIYKNNKMKRKVQSSYYMLSAGKTIIIT